MDQYNLGDRNRILSFKNAFVGILTALKTESNLKIHFLAAVFVIILSIFLNISLADWTKVLILISLVISLELTNTALEVVVDSFTPGEHPQAKIAKDISAGAVLVVTITSVVVGFLIFLPYLT